MKVGLDRDEWWPVYSLSATDPYAWYELEVDVTQELWDEYHAAKKAWVEVQERLKELWRKTDG